MKRTYLAGLLALPLMVFTLALPAGAADPGSPTTCKDGTTSTSTGRGACSGHGGVQKASKSKAAAAPAPAAAATAAPTGATAKCKDGTYSKSKHHSGTCSSHGGVAEWLTAE